jgi:hypothetical protein
MSNDLTLNYFKCRLFTGRTTNNLSASGFPNARGASIMQLHGIHHVTAVTGQVKNNLDFYTKTLGLRLVKRA